MPSHRLSAQLLEELRRYNTPTIANAIEVFNLRPRHVGFLPHQIRCLLPEVGPMRSWGMRSRRRPGRCRTTGASRRRT